MMVSGETAIRRSLSFGLELLLWILRAGVDRLYTCGWEAEKRNAIVKGDLNKMGNQISAFNTTEEKLRIFPLQCVNTDAIVEEACIERMRVSHVRIVLLNAAIERRSVIYQFGVLTIGWLLSR